jgi:rhamnogalacturonan endolyase
VSATIDDANITGSAAGTLTITTTALVRHLTSLNGDVDGSVQVLTGENITLNSNAGIYGDLLVPGTPTVRLNGNATFAGTIDATGAVTPADYHVTLNGSALLRNLVRRVNPLALPVVIAPPAPTGTRSVSLNQPGQSAGDFSTLRNLTLNSGAGLVVVPPGTYGNLIANGSGGFILGVPGSTEPTSYNLQHLTLNGRSQIQLAGPVLLTLANGTSFNGTSVGAAAHPEWLTLQVYSGGLGLNGDLALFGTVIAPSGTVTINGSSTLTGAVAADRLIINGQAVLQDPAE